MTAVLMIMLLFSYYKPCVACKFDVKPVTTRI